MSQRTGPGRRSSRCCDELEASIYFKTLIGQLKGIVDILEYADPEDRRAVYRELDLAVVYHDDGRMQVTAGTRRMCHRVWRRGLEQTTPLRHLASFCGNQRP